MSNLNSILLDAKKGLEAWESIPKPKWEGIAHQLAEDEIKDIQQRLEHLTDELEVVPEWDGDTQDEIHKAIYFFNQILVLYKNI